MPPLSWSEPLELLYDRSTWDMRPTRQMIVERAECAMRELQEDDRRRAASFGLLLGVVAGVAARERLYWRRHNADTVPCCKIIPMTDDIGDYTIRCTRARGHDGECRPASTRRMPATPATTHGESADAEE